MMHTPFCFVHAADIHLGAPFKGVSGAATFQTPGPMSGPMSVQTAHTGKSGTKNTAADMTNASYAALKNLEQLCLASKAAFLVLAGDVYDEKDGILRARLALRDMFARLGDAGIRVFFAHGNHDPLESGPAIIRWPENVTVFSGELSTHTVTRNGENLAALHGISHSNAKEKNNLARLFSRPAPSLLGSPRIHIGVLHCALGGKSDGHAPYAPCTEKDLRDSGLDYWALGHVHSPQCVCASPLAVYPGSLQGMHINESGAHGAYVVTVDAQGSCTPVFHDLAPVRWEKLSIDISPGAEDAQDAEPPTTLDALEDLLLQRLWAHADGLEGAARDLIYRLTLTGGSRLDSALRRPQAAQDLLERLREAVGRPVYSLDETEGPIRRLWLKDLRLQTRKLSDQADAAGRSDLLGELLRQSAAIQADESALHALAEEALHSLYAHSQLRKLVAMPDTAELAEMLNEASALCSGMLEGE